MKFIFLLAGLFCTLAHADEYDLNSPIAWTALVQNNGVSTTYRGKDFGIFLKDGLVNEKLKLKCTFEFNKGFTSKIKSADGKRNLGNEYNEKVWINCKLGDVAVSINAINCIDSKTHFSDYDSQGIFFNLSQTNVVFTCLVKDKK